MTTVEHHNKNINTAEIISGGDQKLLTIGCEHRIYYADYVEFKAI